MNNLQLKFQEANFLHDKRDFEGAIKKYKVVLSQLIKFPKTSDRQFKLASTYLNLGNSFKENSEFNKAEKFFDKALEIFQKLNQNSGDFRKQIAWCYNNIGGSHLMQRNFGKAQGFNRKALKIRETLFEENKELYKIDYLMSLYNISISQQQLTKRQGYIESLKKYISEFEEMRIEDNQAISYYEDAKNRLEFATNPNYNQLKPLSELKEELPKFIKKYHGFEPTIEQTNEIIQEFREICGGSIIMSEQRNELEQFYFRIRDKKSMKEGDQFHPSQFSHPPPQYTGFGRVNLSKHPVFYGGERIEVVVQETHIKEGEGFYLSCWRSNKFYPKYAIMHSKLINSKRLSTHKEAREQKINDSLKSLPNIAAESFEYIFETLSELFTAKDWTIPSAIGYNLLYNNSNIDGIEYPDVKTKTSYNFALKPEAACKLSLMRTYLCQLTNGKIEFYKTGILKDGKIEYSNYEEEDHPFKIEGIRVYKEQ